MTAQPFGKRKLAPPSPPASYAVRKSAPERTIAVVRAPTPATGSVLAQSKNIDLSRGTPAAALPAPASVNADDRADLVTFFGPNSEKYIQLYDKLTAKPHSVSINWSAFFLGFVWFFYRKQYLMGAIFVLLPVVLTFLLPIGGGASGSVFAGTANKAYIGEAKRRMKKANELGLTGEERSDYLRRAGGVSLPAGIVAGLLYAGMIALAFVK